VPEFIDWDTAGELRDDLRMAVQQAIEECGSMEYVIAISANCHSVRGRFSHEINQLIRICGNMTELQQMERDLGHCQERAQTANRAKTLVFKNLGHEIRPQIQGII
jgi:hypothetical protein